jgi:hypothetical protein
VGLALGRASLCMPCCLHASDPLSAHVFCDLPSLSLSSCQRAATSRTCRTAPPSWAMSYWPRSSTVACSGTGRKPYRSGQVADGVSARALRRALVCRADPTLGRKRQARQEEGKERRRQEEEEGRARAHQRTRRVLPSPNNPPPAGTPSTGVATARWPSTQAWSARTSTPTSSPAMEGRWHWVIMPGPGFKLSLRIASTNALPLSSLRHRILCGPASLAEPGRGRGLNQKLSSLVQDWPPAVSWLRRVVQLCNAALSAFPNRWRRASAGSRCGARGSGSWMRCGLLSPLSGANSDMISHDIHDPM